MREGQERTLSRIYIAGAHSRGRTLRKYLEYLYPDVLTEAFLVDDMSENRDMVDGIPVRLIGSGLCTDYPVYIGMRGANHPKVMKELREAGMKEIIPLTVELDMRLRNQFIRKYWRSEGRTFRLVDDLQAEACCPQKTARIYVACSVLDMPLSDEYHMTGDETMLQVGAALTTQRLSSEVITDCTGENISHKNRQYCELTGLYWVWKNALEDYVGLAHYRRHFLLPDDWVPRVIANHVDVILPVPLYVEPSIADNYMERHDSADWEYMMEYFRNELPDEYADAKRFFEGYLYSPCNMIIARREVLRELCGWLYPVVDAVAAHGGKREDTYMNRYPGFISERLITYFFERHREKYTIAYANKNFLR